MDGPIWHLHVHILNLWAANDTRAAFFSDADLFTSGYSGSKLSVFCIIIKLTLSSLRKMAHMYRLLAGVLGHFWRSQSAISVRNGSIGIGVDLLDRSILCRLSVFAGVETHKYLKPITHYTTCPKCQNLKLLHVLCGHCLRLLDCCYEAGRTRKIQWRCTRLVYVLLLCTNRRGYLPLGVLLSTQSNWVRPGNKTCKLSVLLLTCEGVCILACLTAVVLR